MRLLTLTLAAFLLTALAPTASFAVVAGSLVTNLTDDDVFGGSNISVDTTAVVDNNKIAVYTLSGSGFSGGGFGFSISNGENGIDSSEGGTNTDVPNPNPVDPAIMAVNGGGRLQNGNVVRVSAWFQQDPNDPITIEPSVEPVLKLELWKEFDSQNGDFTSGRQATAGFGDRLWDTDINAPDPTWAGFNQSEAARIDLNNDGDIANGDSLTISLPPTTTGSEWIQLVSQIVIDDTPDDQGGAGFFWEVAGEQFQVDAVEEIRATMFVGDFAGNDLTGGGSFFVDNFLFEVFPDQATANATPIDSPFPTQDFVPGDYNEDGTVDAADYAVFRDNLGADEGTLPNDIDGGTIGTAQYDTWAANFGSSLPGASGTAAIPEPGSLVLAAMGLGLLARRRF